MTWASVSSINKLSITITKYTYILNCSPFRDSSHYSSLAAVSLGHRKSLFELDLFHRIRSTSRTVSRSIGMSFFMHRMGLHKSTSYYGT